MYDNYYRITLKFNKKSPEQMKLYKKISDYSKQLKKKKEPFADKACIIKALLYKKFIKK